MQHKKFECSNGWIVAVWNPESLEVIEIHSNGYISYGTDDNADNDNYPLYIEGAIINNELHSQQGGKCGIRWPEED